MPFFRRCKGRVGSGHSLPDDVRQCRADASRLASDLARCERGAMAVFLAIAIIPLVAFVGLAVDTTRGYLVKSRLSSAVDAAALAGGRVYTSANRDADIQMYFTANFPNGFMSATTQPLQITPNDTDKKLTVAAQASIPTTFMRLVGIDTIPISSSAEVAIESQNIEVALVLDITGSMKGQPLADLKAAANELIDIVVQDDQSLFYSKMALIPYSQSVNVGTAYADKVRGKPEAKKISSITKGSTTIINSTNHGFSTGDKIYIVNANNSSSYPLNNTLSSNDSSWRDLTPKANSTRPNFWAVRKIDDNSFSLRRCDDDNDSCADADTSAVSSSSWSSYSANTASIYCTTPGCQYLAFRRDNDNYWVTWKISDRCVTERVGANVATDAAPSATRVGPRYVPDSSSGNDCVSSAILPLTSNKSTLHSRINDLDDGGSTAGQIGIAWGWYMLSPTFDNPHPSSITSPDVWSADTKIWPTDSQPAAYGTPKLMKVVIIMTDGEFNTPYRNGVIAQDAGSNSGGSNFKINQNSDNGDPFTQAQNLCTAMKAPGKGIVVYTVGFNISSSTAVTNLLNNCATSPSYVYLPEGGEELQDAFQDIAMKISKLRLSH
jgi:Flp pilus assembly protein TadG